MKKNEGRWEDEGREKNMGMMTKGNGEEREKEKWNL